MKVKVKKTHPDAKMPSYAHPGDVGLDMYSVDEAVIEPGDRKLLNCGFALEFPEGYAAIVKDKGGPPHKYGLHCLGGVFDAGYRGEYNVNLVNLGHEKVTIEKGQKIAQLVLFPVAIAELEETEELSDSSRKDGKFGSTGVF